MSQPCGFSTLKTGAGAIRHWIACVVSLAILTGCATGKNFKEALTEPAAASDAAAAVVASASADVLRANALGLVESPPANPSYLVCAKQDGLSAASLDLGKFGEALKTVDKVGAKPDDVSFAGYIAQIRKNGEALKDAGAAPNIEQQLAQKKQAKNYNRCVALLEADWNARPQLASDPSMQLLNIGPALGVVLAFRDLALTLLKYGEAAQRDAAVRATVDTLLPQLDAAAKRLRAEVNPATFGSRVVYADAAPGKPALAQEMNKSNLGAAISIQRWMTARQIRATWDSLASCRDGTTRTSCLGNAEARANAADFSVQVASYRSLAAFNDKEILDALDGAIKKAQDSHGSLADLLDALSAIGDAVADIAGQADAVKEARK